jgi:hypothetical protein
MNQTQKSKATFNATIKTYRLAERKFNIDDVLADLELAEIVEARRKSNASNRGSEPERVTCWCAEGIVNGRRIAVHRPADCEYVTSRSALVFEAARIAMARVGDSNGDASLGRTWTRVFNFEMDRLAAPLLR